MNEASTFVARFESARDGERVRIRTARANRVVVGAQSVAALAVCDCCATPRADAHVKRIEGRRRRHGQPVANFATHVRGVHEQHRHGHVSESTFEDDIDSVTTFADPVHRDEYAARANFAGGRRWAEHRAIAGSVRGMRLQGCAHSFVVVGERVDFRSKILGEDLPRHRVRQGRGTRHE